MKYFAFICSLLFLFINPSSGQTTFLKLKNEQRIKIESSTSVVALSEVMGQSMENNFDFSSISEVAVTAVRDGEYDLQKKIIRLTGKSVFMGNEMNYDSDSPDKNSPLSANFDNLKDKKVELTITTKGVVQKETGNFESAFPSIAGINFSFNNDFYIPELLSKELKEGDNVSSTTKTTGDKYTRSDEGVYSIMKIENNIAYITYAGKEKSSMQFEQMGMESTSESTGSVIMDIQMDLSSGLILSKKITSEATMNTSISGMIVPSSTKTTTTIKITF